MEKTAIWTAPVLVLALATPAFPCTVTRLATPQELVERAQLIVRVRTEGMVDIAGTRDNVLVITPGQLRFRVLEVLKGTLASEELTFNGRLEEEDDWNDRPTPYDFVRPGGRRGNCHALGYRAGAEYLIFLRQSGTQGDRVVGWTPYWAALAPTNEQLRGPDDRWLKWVVQEVKRNEDRRATSLPAAIRATLDERYPGWRVADVSREVLTTIGERLGPTPGVVSGDFDGNGRRDYAMMIEYRNTDEPGKAFTHFLEALAFLDSSGSFTLVRLRDRQPGPNPDQFLTLQKRGAQGFDFEANKKFTYPHDSIGEWYFGKAAGGSYIYGGGRFRYVIEVD